MLIIGEQCVVIGLKFLRSSGNDHIMSGLRRDALAFEIRHGFDLSEFFQTYCEF